MGKVAIVTDTTACIPREQVVKYGIEIVPVQLIFEGKTYRDGIDISPTEFYTLMRQADKLATTASSSSAPYLEAFRQASQGAESVLCLTEPSKFSAMHTSALVAKDMAKEAIPEVALEVIDCTTAAGGSLNEVAGKARHTMHRVNLFAMLDTLHYLVKSGRVPQAVAMVNSLLKIKPVFSLNHADAHVVALPRTIPGAMKRMLKLVESKVEKGQPLHVAVMHADAPGNAAALKNRIASQFDCAELFITEFTPVMGAHTGPGLLGIAFYSGDHE